MTTIIAHIGSSTSRALGASIRPERSHVLTIGNAVTSGYSKRCFEDFDQELSDWDLDSEEMPSTFCATSDSTPTTAWFASFSSLGTLGAGVTDATAPVTTHSQLVAGLEGLLRGIRDDVMEPGKNSRTATQFEEYLDAFGEPGLGLLLSRIDDHALSSDSVVEFLRTLTRAKSSRVSWEYRLFFAARHLRHPDADVRDAAADAVVDIGGIKGRAYLMQAIAAEPLGWLRENMLAAAAELEDWQTPT